MVHRNNGPFAVIFAFALLLAGVGCVGSFVVNEVEGTVVDKERVCRNTSDRVVCRYEVRIHGINGHENEVLENRDEIVHGKFNSADVQNNLIVGEKYRFRVSGWRIPVLSAFRNIIGYERI